jgi:CRP-like cAMP-binding protein
MYPMYALPPSALARELAQSPIFSGCTAQQREWVSKEAAVKQERRGFRIADSEGSFPYLGFVCSGVIGIAALPEGRIRGVRRLSLYEALPGSTFGEVAVIDQAPALGEISVLSKRATYALIPAVAVVALADADPALLARLASSAALRCRQLVSRIALQHAWPVTARVARVLLPFATDAPGLHPAKPQLWELAQRDIAASAGCVTEAAARAIAALEADGAVRREHGRIRYASRQRLARYCDRT